ncbi:MAG TPA: LamG-like jellyroll fold domain-containing protein, partial [Lacipirellulaceae bacterium]
SASASQLTLNGGASATAAYVDLPNGIISDLTDASFEAWYTISSAQNWGRIFDFGSTTAAATMGELTGPGGGGNGQDFLFYSPVRGTNLAEQRVGFGNQDLLFGGAQAGNAGAGVYSDLDPEFNHVLGQQYHAIVVVDADGAGAGQGTVALYINGALAPQAPGQVQANPFPVAHQLANLNDVNNWLGRSNWTGDANFAGSYNEFRIYDHAMSESEVTNDFLVGPDAAPGATAVSLQVNKTNGQVSLVNHLSQPLQIDYYELTSAAGALNPAGWTGIDGNTASGEGWDKSGASNANSLIELYLPESGYTFPAMGELPIGAAFNPAVFGSGNDGDVQFGLVLASGAFLSGNVTYVTSMGIPGDYNQNGRVDAADYVLWRKNPAAFGGTPAGYNTWRTNFGRTSGSGAGSATAVPEPVGLWSLSCGAIVLCAWIARKRREGGNLMFAGVKIVTCTRSAVFIFAMMLVSSAWAGFPDRIYRMGDDPQENPSIGNVPNADFGSFTVDSQFFDQIGFSDASDLSYIGSGPAGGPTYFDAGSGALARPGAATGTFGLQFAGSDLLFGTGTKGALGVPAQGDNNYNTDNGAPGYTNITTRYIEGWVRPTGGAGTRRDVVNDSGRFSIFINTSNNWAILNGATTLNSTTPAALNTWTHVMHRTFGSGGGAALYVNGIAVAATTAGYATGDQGGAALDMIIGAGLDRTSNFFSGQLDEFTIGVAGNNTGQPGGRDYGAVNLGEDNAFVKQNLTGVNAGDINRDGSVNTTDINTFVANWRRVQQVNGVTVGDLNSRLFGDLN